MPAEPSTAGATAASVLAPGSVRLGQHAVDKWDVLRRSAAVLEEAGAVDPGYGDAMADRERSVSTYLGEGVAIPHGTNESRALIRRTALGFLQFPDGVDWGLPDGERVVVAIPIAASGQEHLGLLSALAEVLLDPDRAQALRTAGDPAQVLAVLGGTPEQTGGTAGENGPGAGRPAGEQDGVVA